MTKIYEGMFVLDNEVVREDWKRAKEVVTGTLEKHGAKVHAARRWDERRLAYPIKRRRRGTYLLTYYEIPAENIVSLGRDFELSEPILRYLLTSAEAVPEEELKLSELENAADFTVPPPPEDDAAELEAQPSEAEREAEGERKESGDGEESPAGRGGDAKAAAEEEGSSKEAAPKEAASTEAAGEAESKSEKEG